MIAPCIYIPLRRVGMAEAFNAQRETIGGLLNSLASSRVVVPMFQRGYMWQKKHVEAFWKDLKKHKDKSALRNAPERHFFGPIVTLIEEKDGEEIINLLDGQQRLATATILLSVIRDVAREIGTSTGIPVAHELAAIIQNQVIEKDDGGFTLELGQTDALFFREYVQRNQSPTIKPKIRTHKNIVQARKILADNLKTITGEITPNTDALKAIGELKTFRKIILNDLIMARIPVTSSNAAYSIFETLNDRGLRLSGPDLLLNFLMGTAPEADLQNIRDLWTEMIHRMGTHDINVFLRHMWISKYGDLKEVDLFTALRAHIEGEKIASVDFVRLCADECENYVRLIDVDEDEIGKDSAPFVRALIKELHINSALPLLLSCYPHLKPPEFSSVVKLLLVFVVRYYIVGGLDAASMEDLFYSLAREVRETLESTPLTVDKTVHKRCIQHIKTRLAALSPDDATLRLRIPALILDAGDAKYVVNRLARHIQSPTKEITLHESNVEHIFPQNPEKDEWGGKENQEKLEEYLWNIGNLTIFGRRMNRKAANKEFDIKRAQYDEKTEVIMTKQLAQNYTVWDETTIKDRAFKLTDKMLEIWNFDNPSRV